MDVEGFGVYFRAQGLEFIRGFRLQSCSMASGLELVYLFGCRVHTVCCGFWSLVFIRV